MLKIVPALLLFLLAYSGFAQIQPVSRTADTSWNFPTGTLRTNVSLGSEYGVFSGSGSVFTSWISPSFGYAVSPKLMIGGGFTLYGSHFSYKGMADPGMAVRQTEQYSDAVVHVYGRYLMNDRLTLSGSAFKSLTGARDPLPYDPFRPVYGRPTQGVDFNVGYRVGKNAFIQAGFRYSEGASPRDLRNPFGTSSYGPAGGYFPGQGNYFPGW